MHFGGAYMYSLFSHAREPVNSFTHFIGSVLSSIGTVILLSAAQQAAAPQILIGVMIFGLSLIALYSASALYHYVRVSPAALLRFRKLDHSMIFVLIAGTYTPLFLRFSSQNGVFFTGIIWGIALMGILLKLVWMDMPRFLSTLFYVAMGWAIVFDPLMLASLPTGCTLLLLMGGLAYTSGAVIYWIKKPNFLRSLGFHELFHLFVLTGSIFHFLAILLYIL